MNSSNNNKKNKFKNFVVAFLLLIITYLVIIYLSNRDNSFNTTLPVSNIENIEKKDMKEILKDNMYVVQNINENKEAYEINIYYPYTNDNTLNSYINRKIELYIKDIKFEAANYKNEVKEGKYKLDIVFDVTKGNNGYISYIFMVVTDTKYIHPNESFFVVNYDTKSKKILLNEDIEKLYPNLYYNLSEYTYNKLSENEEIKNMGALNMLKEGTRAGKYNFMDIAFKENNMAVLFERYQVAPYILGTFEVLVPLEYLK